MSTFVLLVLIFFFGFLSETEARHGQMSGKLMEVLWRIDAAGYRSRNILTYRYQYILTEIDNNQFTFGYKLRNSPMEGANCTVISGDMNALGRFISQNKVILDNEPPLPEPLGVSDWRYWFMSDHPGDYIITFACYDRNKIRNGICYTQWFVEIHIPVDKLDNPPMQCIVDEMWNKLGLKFSNELNTFLSIGYPCDGSL